MEAASMGSLRVDRTRPRILPSPGRALQLGRAGVITTENVWSATRLQGSSVGEKTSLRKYIQPLVEIGFPGHDELRACLSLQVGRSLFRDQSRYQAADTPL